MARPTPRAQRGTEIDRMPAPPHRQRPGWRRTALAWGAEWSVALGLWVLFAGSLSWHELAVGAVAAGAAATGSRIAWSSGDLSFRGHLRDVLTIRHVPRYVVTGTWEVLVVLARHLSKRQPAGSLLREVPMDATGDDPVSQARLALAIAYTTATPSSVVLGVDRERRVLVYHQLVRGDIPEMTRRLGARG
jgi:multisubunit Na+/H+ antiporter MnhE subunit